MCEVPRGSRTEATEGVVSGGQAGEGSLRPRGWDATLGRGPLDGDQSSATCGFQSNHDHSSRL